MRIYGESKTSQIMMSTVPHVTSGLGLRKYQADGFLLARVYKDHRWNDTNRINRGIRKETASVVLFPP